MLPKGLPPSEVIPVTARSRASNSSSSRFRSPPMICSTLLGMLPKGLPVCSAGPAMRALLPKGLPPSVVIPVTATLRASSSSNSRLRSPPMICSTLLGILPKGLPVCSAGPAMRVRASTRRTRA
ncbi:hypothetical protein PLICRDRAFT_234806 [Plicaturopsis crispa FD-325 SS-3]|nr:hypothetical protein PLICRDRAFT_234806 [Plicaturopsis crispa FD-325 SS-3]